MQQFKGRVVVPGTCTAEALVSHGGFNTLASYQMAMMFGDKQVKCGDQNNPDIYKKPMIGKGPLPAPDHRLHHRRHGALHGVLPRQAARLYALLPAHRLPGRIRRHSGRCLDRQQNARGGLPGDEFLQYVQTGMTVTVGDDGLVTVED